jgi:hypothetical protein
MDEVAPPQVEADTEVDGGHGRIETRTARVLRDFQPWVQSGSRWPDCRTSAPYPTPQTAVPEG